ncbi:ImmA/IrrE family metallo-endopeptidase [Burkholderia gladioli]|uniref:ImmA/IrrE family metallo-endopeptidase n=1 Tax=Burkholderia gladioli TaxID=28095 RepID=UPI00163FB44C|nr:ImmA/IrrE family metallo-endopeptidase [Burkholderia gladioli]
MMPARPRYSRISREVSDLLDKAGVEDAPVPVEEIAAMVGARVTYNDFQNEISGLLLRRSQSIVIGVASEQSEARQRFTIAHEIGHLLLHEGEELHVDADFRVNLRSSASSRADDVTEIEANAFAASLLMPIEFLKKDVARMRIDVEDCDQIEQLANKYGVSAQAMTFRLINLFGARR